MCAIAGIYSLAGRPVELRTLETMVRVQAHRGPDGEGYVLLDPSAREKPLAIKGPGTPAAGARRALGLGHRRLAIVDLSPLGHQPMATEDGRNWVTYNGEIYNHIELREELRGKGHRFRSASDTEVLLAAYREWGDACLARFNGMFAFALWDGVRRRLFCARDRFGEKPFYYHWDGEHLFFASEIKALLAASVRAAANPRVVFDYLDGAYLDHTEATFFDGIRQLPPAHALSIEGDRLALARYWELPDAAEDGSRSSREAAERFRDLFREAVCLRLRSDVPIGTCLSGGLDSSSVVCVANELMFVDRAVPRALVGTRQRTFSSCFDDPAYDERRFIAPVLGKTGAESHYTFPDPKELAGMLSKLVWQQDEPFGSTSIFAQWCVMRLAAQRGVKVLLDGQGADELLAGYQSFFGARFADLLARGRAVALLRELRAYRRLYGPVSRYAIARLARALLPVALVGRVRSRLTGSAGWLAADFRRQWGDAPAQTVSAGPRRSCSHVRRLQHELLTGKGLRALLHYEDRNSMAFGVEARLPFLDHRLVEFVYGLDESQKIRDGWTKVVLRDAMDGILPDAVRWRADKMGFVTPEAFWFRTTLRDPAREILADRRTRARGYLDVDAVLRAFDEHAAGRADHSPAIWRWLNVELWCRMFLDQPTCAASSS
jgi:asparagine synthase (glutamine-hydrolysing)